MLEGVLSGAVRSQASSEGRRNFSRSRSSGPLGALLSSLALDVRLMTALQVLQGYIHTPVAHQSHRPMSGIWKWSDRMMTSTREPRGILTWRAHSFLDILYIYAAAPLPLACASGSLFLRQKYCTALGSLEPSTLDMQVTPPSISFDICSERPLPRPARSRCAPACALHRASLHIERPRFSAAHLVRRRARPAGRSLFGV